MPRADEKRRFWTPEFVLLLTKLLVLLVLVVLVLFIPLSSKSAAEVTFQFVPEYRKTILSITEMTFGAWVSAIAAGNILPMREQSPHERLCRPPIRGISPKPIDWVVKTKNGLKTIIDTLKRDPQCWFITVTEDDGALKALLREQVTWRFVDERTSENTSYEDALKSTVSDVIDYPADEVISQGILWHGIQRSLVNRSFTE